MVCLVFVSLLISLIQRELLVVAQDYYDERNYVGQVDPWRIVPALHACMYEAALASPCHTSCTSVQLQSQLELPRSTTPSLDFS